VTLTLRHRWRGLRILAYTAGIAVPGTLEQLHRGNVERVAAYLSLEQALAGTHARDFDGGDLAAAARNLGNRGLPLRTFRGWADRAKDYIWARRRSAGSHRHRRFL